MKNYLFIPFGNAYLVPVAESDANNNNTNTNMTTDKLITKCETQSILLVITNADETISSQGYYWSAQEAIRAARNSGKYYTVRNTDTGKLIEAQW